jgi:hypothetical protein
MATKKHPSRGNGRQLAEFLGISEAQVSKDSARGLYVRGKDGKFDFKKAKKAHDSKDPLRAKKQQARNRRSKSENKSDTSNHRDGRSYGDGFADQLNKIRVAERGYKAQRAKIELDQLQGELISRKVVRATQRETVIRFRAMCRAIPDRLASIVASIDDEREIHQLMCEEYDAALEAVTGTNWESHPANR